VGCHGHASFAGDVSAGGPRAKTLGRKWTEFRPEGTDVVKKLLPERLVEGKRLRTDGRGFASAIRPT
jgi:hypothetical protein